MTQNGDCNHVVTGHTIGIQSVFVDVIHLAIAIDAAAVRYARDDENNAVFAKLENLVLTAEQSRARDTTNQNRGVEEVRAELDRKAAGGVATAVPTDLVQLIQQMANDLAEIRSQVTTLQDKLDAQSKVLRELQDQKK